MPDKEGMKRFLQESKLFLSMIKTLQTEYDFSSGELFEMMNRRDFVPATIFSSKISPLKALVYYLKDDQKLSFKKIADKIGRSYRAVWGAYSKNELKYTSTEYMIPLNAFKSKLSILETAVKFLKEHYELRYTEIAKLLNKDQRTIWTVYKRAQQKGVMSIE